MSTEPIQLPSHKHSNLQIPKLLTEKLPAVWLVVDAYGSPVFKLNIIGGTGWCNGIMLASQMSDPGSMSSPSNQR